VTTSELAAIGRHAVTSLASVVTCLSVLHIINQGDAQTLSVALTKISADVADIFAAIGPVVVLLSGWYASYKASHDQMIRDVNAIDKVKVVREDAPVPQVNTVPK
jgi:hypothetical protein